MVLPRPCDDCGVRVVNRSKLQKLCLKCKRIRYEAGFGLLKDRMSSGLSKGTLASRS